MKSVQGNLGKDGKMVLAVDLARLSTNSLPDIPMWLGTHIN